MSSSSRRLRTHDASQFESLSAQPALYNINTAISTRSDAHVPVNINDTSTISNTSTTMFKPSLNTAATNTITGLLSDPSHQINPNTSTDVFSSTMSGVSLNTSNIPFFGVDDTEDDFNNRSVALDFQNNNTSDITLSDASSTPSRLSALSMFNLSEVSGNSCGSLYHQALNPEKTIKIDVKQFSVQIETIQKLFQSTPCNLVKYFGENAFSLHNTALSPLPAAENMINDLPPALSILPTIQKYISVLFYVEYQHFIDRFSQFPSIISKQHQIVRAMTKHAQKPSSNNKSLTPISQLAQNNTALNTPAISQQSDITDLPLDVLTDLLSYDSKITVSTLYEGYDAVSGQSREHHSLLKLMKNNNESQATQNSNLNIPAYLPSNQREFASIMHCLANFAPEFYGIDTYEHVLAQHQRLDPSDIVVDHVTANVGKITQTNTTVVMDDSFLHSSNSQRPYSLKQLSLCSMGHNITLPTSIVQLLTTEYMDTIEENEVIQERKRQKTNSFAKTLQREQNISSQCTNNQNKLMYVSLILLFTLFFTRINIIMSRIHLSLLFEYRERLYDQISQKQLVLTALEKKISETSNEQEQSILEGNKKSLWAFKHGVFRIIPHIDVSIGIYKDVVQKQLFSHDECTYVVPYHQYLQNQQYQNATGSSNNDIIQNALNPLTDNQSCSQNTHNLGYGHDLNAFGAEGCTLTKSNDYLYLDVIDTVYHQTFTKLFFTNTIYTFYPTSILSTVNPSITNSNLLLHNYYKNHPSLTNTSFHERIIILFLNSSFIIPEIPKSALSDENDHDQNGTLIDSLSSQNLPSQQSIRPGPTKRKRLSPSLAQQIASLADPQQISKILAVLALCLLVPPVTTTTTPSDLHYLSLQYKEDLVRHLLPPITTQSPTPVPPHYLSLKDAPQTNPRTQTVAICGSVIPLADHNAIETSRPHLTTGCPLFRSVLTQSARKIDLFGKTALMPYHVYIFPYKDSKLPQNQSNNPFSSMSNGSVMATPRKSRLTLSVPSTPQHSTDSITSLTTPPRTSRTPSSRLCSMTPLRFQLQNSQQSFSQTPHQLNFQTSAAPLPSQTSSNIFPEKISNNLKNLQVADRLVYETRIQYYEAGVRGRKWVRALIYSYIDNCRQKLYIPISPPLEDREISPQKSYTLSLQAKLIIKIIILTSWVYYIQDTILNSNRDWFSRNSTYRDPITNRQNVLNIMHLDPSVRKLDQLKALNEYPPRGRLLLYSMLYTNILSTPPKIKLPPGKPRDEYTKDEIRALKAQQIENNTFTAALHKEILTFFGFQDVIPHEQDSTSIPRIITAEQQFNNYIQHQKDILWNGKMTRRVYDSDNITIRISKNENCNTYLDAKAIGLVSGLQDDIACLFARSTGNKRATTTILSSSSSTASSSTASSSTLFHPQNDITEFTLPYRQVMGLMNAKSLPVQEYTLEFLLEAYPQFFWLYPSHFTAKNCQTNAKTSGKSVTSTPSKNPGAHAELRWIKQLAIKDELSYIFTYIISVMNLFIFHHTVAYNYNNSSATDICDSSQYQHYLATFPSLSKAWLLHVREKMQPVGCEQGLTFPEILEKHDKNNFDHLYVGMNEFDVNYSDFFNDVEAQHYYGQKSKSDQYAPATNESLSLSSSIQGNEVTTNSIPFNIILASIQTNDGGRTDHNPLHNQTTFPTPKNLPPVIIDLNTTAPSRLPQTTTHTISMQESTPMSPYNRMINTSTNEILNNTLPELNISVSTLPPNDYPSSQKVGENAHIVNQPLGNQLSKLNRL